LQKKDVAETVLQKEFVQKEKIAFKKIKRRLKKISAKPLQKKRKLKKPFCKKAFRAKPFAKKTRRFRGGKKKNPCNSFSVQFIILVK
jgi:hypothetical protein